MEFNWEIISKIVGPLATLLAAIIAAWIARKYQKGNLDLAHEKMEKELFTEFNKRYDELNDSLSLLTAKMTIEDLYEELYKIKDKTLYNVVIDYFNLCSEQYYWYKKNRISKEIWNAWHSGMMYYYDTFPVIKDTWEKETKGEGYKSYYLKEPLDFFRTN